MKQLNTSKIMGGGALNPSSDTVIALFQMERGLF